MTEFHSDEEIQSHAGQARRVDPSAPTATGELRQAAEELRLHLNGEAASAPKPLDVRARETARETRVGSLFVRAQDFIDQSVADARNEAIRALAEARIASQSILSEARGSSERSMSEARAAAEEIVSEARASAARIVSDARESAEGIISEARASAESSISEARKHAEDVVSAARAEAQSFPAGSHESAACTPQDRSSISPEALRQLERTIESFRRVNSELTRELSQLSSVLVTRTPGNGNAEHAPLTASPLTASPLGASH